MSVRRTNTSRNLQFQKLEAREQFAADLNLQFVNGDLTITGDGDAEQVVVEEFRFLNGFEVISVKGQNGTTVNGQATVAIGSGNVRNININLNGGDDFLTLKGVDNDVAGGDLNIRLGGGNDTLTMTNVNILDDISIEGEGERDFIVATDLTAHDFVLNAGNGDDDVRLFNVDAVDAFFVDMGFGDDLLSLNECNAGRFDLNGGGGNNDVLRVVGGNTIQFGNIVLDGIKAAQSARNFEAVVTEF